MSVKAPSRRPLATSQVGRSMPRVDAAEKLRGEAEYVGDMVVPGMLQGKVLPGCYDVELAQESFREVIEIADLLILGRDNVALNPLRSPVGM